MSGIFVHYKHQQYFVLGIGRLDATDEPCVVYVRMYGFLGDAPSGSPMSVRTLQSFQEEVKWDDGVMRPRFISLERWRVYRAESPAS